jgi:hypothetical protein
LSGQFGNSLADGFQLADGFLAKQHRHKAPIDATTASEPKNIVGEPVYGSNMKGATTPATSRPHDSPKYCPRPRSAVGNCSDKYTRTAVKVDSTVKPVISAPATNTTVA